MIPIKTAGTFLKPVTDFGNGFFIASGTEPKLIEIYINKAFMIFPEINKHTFQRQVPGCDLRGTSVRMYSISLRLGI